MACFNRVPPDLSVDRQSRVTRPRRAPIVAPPSGRSFLFLVAVIATTAVATSAESLADAPSVSYIFPAGGQRGKTVDVHVGGHYLHDDCPFEMLGDGVAAPSHLRRASDVTWFEGPVIPLPGSQRKEDYPWEHIGRLNIAPDATLGFRRWRVTTSQGVTPTMKFVVGDLPELVEEEIAGEPRPTQVALPVTINGRIFPREDVDVWTFEAQAGTSYVCDIVAQRIGSPLDARLEIRDPHDRPVAENVAATGQDAFVRFTAADSGTYAVRIHDVDFGGLQHYVYRLTITAGPHVQHVFPLGGQRGTTTEFTLGGQRTPTRPLTLPLPDTIEMAYQHRFVIDGQTVNPVLLDIGDAPESREAEPNDSAGDANTIELPAVLNGRIERPGDIDTWRFAGKRGERLEFDVRAARLGSPLDSVLAVYDAEGKQLGSNDDRGGISDSRLAITLPQDGLFRIEIRERFSQRGGEAFAYRIHAGPAQPLMPGFEVNLPTDGLTLPRGAETKLKFVAARRGGFTGPIEIRFDGLPAGVEVSGNEIPAKKSDTQVVFKVDAKAPVQVQRVRVRGAALIAEQEVVQPIVQAATSREDMDVDHLAVAIAMPTPFKVIGEFETHYAERGSTFTRHFSIDRGGYDGPLKVRLAERQVRHLQGVSGSVVDVPAGEDEFDYQIKLPPWMEIGRTSRTCVMAVAEVKDETGNLHTVSYTSHAQNDQVIVLVDPGQLDLKLANETLTAQPGSTYELDVGVARGKGIAGDVRLELVCSAHIQGLSAQPIVVTADQQHGTLNLEFATDSIGPFNRPLVIRATARREGLPYTAERLLTVVPAQP